MLDSRWGMRRELWLNLGARAQLHADDANQQPSNGTARADASSGSRRDGVVGIRIRLRGGGGRAFREKAWAVVSAVARPLTGSQLIRNTGARSVDGAGGLVQDSRGFVEHGAQLVEDARAVLVRPGRVDGPRRHLSRLPRWVVKLRARPVSRHGSLVRARIVEPDVGVVDRPRAVGKQCLCLPARL